MSRVPAKPRCTPPEAAGAEEPDPGEPAHRQGAAHGRRPDRELDCGRGEIPRPDLAGVGGRGELLELGPLQTDPDGAVENPDRGRNRSCSADALLALPRDFGALGRRESM